MSGPTTGEQADPRIRPQNLWCVSAVPDSVDNFASQSIWNDRFGFDPVKVGALARRRRRQAQLTLVVVERTRATKCPVDAGLIHEAVGN